jgi:hypothetical protein
MVYLSTLSAGHYASWNERINEYEELIRIWKEGVMACFEVRFGSCIGGLRKIIKNVSQDSRPTCRNLNP